jgi:ABC-type Fe3+-citrate transport system substrate-binding protein
MKSAPSIAVITSGGRSVRASRWATCGATNATNAIGPAAAVAMAANTVATMSSASLVRDTLTPSEEATSSPSTRADRSRLKVSATGIRSSTVNPTGTASFSGIVLTDADLARPRSQDVEDFAAEISAERIKDANADAIFVTAYADDKGLGTKTLEQFKANPLWKPLAPKVHEVEDITWMTAVGLQGAWVILRDLADAFGVDAPTKS